jgi:hypothetical protein
VGEDDYLESRSDVDPERMGVTGLSGGGVISWCLGAADKRVKVVVPVCQSGSIEQVVTDRSTVAVFGEGETAPLAIYAALLDESISEIVIANPPACHEDPETPELLGILRTGDLPHNLALAWPRPITFIGDPPDAYEWTRQIYEKLGSGDRIRVIPNIRQWQPATSAGSAE